MRRTSSRERLWGSLTALCFGALLSAEGFLVHTPSAPSRCAHGLHLRSRQSGRDVSSLPPSDRYLTPRASADGANDGESPGSDEEGEAGQEKQPNASNILGQIFQGARQRRAENSGMTGGSSGSGGWSEDGEVEWARYTEFIRSGSVLLANPAVFLKNSRPELAQRFFLPTEMPPLAGANIDNVANLLPVVFLLNNDQNGTTGLVLNRRTGYLVGDLAIDSAGFKIQPVHLGGTAPSQGMFMLHPYPDLPECQKVTDDGLHFGGDYEKAQELVKDGRATSFRFKFFVQQTQWQPGELKKEISDLVWFPASVSREVLLKNRGREGLKMAKPLWTEIMELMGGTFKDIQEGFYRGEF